MEWSTVTLVLGLFIPSVVAVIVGLLPFLHGKAQQSESDPDDVCDRLARVEVEMKHVAQNCNELKARVQQFINLLIRVLSRPGSEHRQEFERLLEELESETPKA